MADAWLSIIHTPPCSKALRAELVHMRLHLCPPMSHNGCACYQERFSPEAEAAHHRFQWLPFGAGPRMCIGAGFAQARSLHARCRFVAGANSIGYLDTS